MRLAFPPCEAGTLAGSGGLVCGEGVGVHDMCARRGAGRLHVPFREGHGKGFPREPPWAQLTAPCSGFAHLRAKTNHTRIDTHPQEHQKSLGRLENGPG